MASRCLSGHVAGNKSISNKMLSKSSFSSLATNLHSLISFPFSIQNKVCFFFQHNYCKLAYDKKAEQETSYAGKEAVVS